MCRSCDGNGVINYDYYDDGGDVRNIDPVREKLQDNKRAELTRLANELLANRSVHPRQALEEELKKYKQRVESIYQTKKDRESKYRLMGFLLGFIFSCILYLFSYGFVGFVLIVAWIGIIIVRGKRDETTNSYYFFESLFKGMLWSLIGYLIIFIINNS